MRNASSTSPPFVTLPHSRFGGLRAAFRLLVFATSALATAAYCLAFGAIGMKTAPHWRRFCALVAHAIGLRLVVRGNLAQAAPRLMVSNHVSYLDIIALGALIEGDFVARADLRGWPFFGMIAQAAGVVFVDRRRAATQTASDQLQERLDADGTLIMFPEATSGDGNRMKPFKSALFAGAERPARGADGAPRPVWVQPVSLAYTRLNGLPLGAGWRPFVAWYGDMDLMPHLWRLLQVESITVEITFHPAVTIGEFANRKALAAHCERLVRDGLARLLAGREPASVPGPVPLL